MSAIVHVSDSTFEHEVEKYPGLAIVDFWATWCTPCRVLSPILEQIAADGREAVRIAKVDIDQNSRTVIRFNVRSAPTLLFFKGGTVVAQIIGTAPRARIEATIAQHA